MFYDVM
jgi:hypothetical protein